MRRRIWGVAGVVVLAAGLAVWLWRADQPRAQTAQWVTAQRMDFDIGVETVGVLDAARAYHVASALRGDRGKILYIVEDGARVETGAELVRFDPTPFETEIQRLQGELGSRSAAAEFAAKGVEMERSQAERSYEQAEFERKKAQQEYQPYLAYIRDLEKLRMDGHAVDSEILQARRKAEQAFTSLQKAEAELERMEKDNAIRIARAIAERMTALKQQLTAP
jgi:HlyD family secretion protein